MPWFLRSTASTTTATWESCLHGQRNSTRLADTAPRDVWPKPKPQSQSLAKFGYLTYQGLTEILGCRPPESQGSADGEWFLAQSRFNEAVFAKLKMRGTTNTFSVGTYHMPCLFGTTEKVRAVNIHSRLPDRTLKYPTATNQQTPSPGGTSSYQLIENGGSAEGIQKEAGSWKEVCILDRLPPAAGGRLQSAYKAFHGKEPLFTNYALSGSQTEPFVATLDYIWFSPEKLQVVACEKLPKKEEVKGPFPNQDEPSDHLPLHATLRFA
eukprot:symbB.v1.2.024510.t1/scaffold2326.1/size131277/14